MNDDNDVVGAPEAPAATLDRAPPGHTVSVGIRLQSVEHSEQPIFSNFTAVQASSGVVFVDFGFIEPQTIAALANLRQPGAKVPETVGGKLACRVALSVDTAASLAQQLNQLLRRPAPARSEPAQPVLPPVAGTATVQ